MLAKNWTWYSGYEQSKVPWSTGCASVIAALDTVGTSLLPADMPGMHSACCLLIPFSHWDKIDIIWKIFEINKCCSGNKIKVLFGFLFVFYVAVILEIHLTKI